MSARALLPLLALLLACEPDVSQVVYLLGDSIADETCDDLRRATLKEDGVLLICNTIPGAVLDDPYWPERIRNLRARLEPDSVFVVLGTNDLNALGGLRPGAIGNLLDALPAEIPVRWLMLSTQGTLDPELRAAANLELIAAAFARPNLDLIEHAFELEDGIHLSAAGEAAFAQRVADMLVLETE